MEDFKDIVELIYFFSGPLLVLVAYLALDQIKVSKNQILEQRNALIITSKRESLKLSSEQITFYGKEIIPSLNILDHRIESENIEFFKKSKVTIRDDGISVVPYYETNDFDKLNKIVPEFTKALNLLEGFSTYFISGVADEKFAYRSLSTTFCESIKDILPLIIYVSDDGHRFSATIELFVMWNSRMETESIKKEKAELEKRLKNKKEISINTLGVEI